jgi:hypothetical protein
MDILFSLYPSYIFSLIISVEDFFKLSDCSKIRLSLGFLCFVFAIDLCASGLKIPLLMLLLSVIFN